MTPGQTVVCIDSKTMHAWLLAKFLEPYAACVKLAHTGEAGVALVSEQSPDIIILDLVMPGLSGHAVLEQVRDARSHIIIQSAYKTDIDLTVIQKPFRPAELRACLEKII